MVQILIVDDEPKFVEPVRKALTRAGFSVKIVYSTGSARRSIRQKVPDAIILDILFPAEADQARLDPLGIDFLKELKGRKRTQRVPVIMVTALSGADVEKQCMAAGAAAYIRKLAGGAQILRLLSDVGVPRPNGADGASGPAAMHMAKYPDS